MFGCSPVTLPPQPDDSLCFLRGARPLTPTWVAPAVARQVESLFGQSLGFLLERPASFWGQFPQAGLAVSLSKRKASAFLKAAAEAQVVPDRAFPALWGRFEKWEVLPVERKDRPELKQSEAVIGNRIQRVRAREGGEGPP